jgi:ATP-dependent Lon protease
LSCKIRIKNDIQSKVRFDLDQQQRIFLATTDEPFKEELGGVSQEEEMEENA